MTLAPFKLERYFARYEFSTELLLCSSDVEGLPMRDLLALADDETRALWDNLGLGYTESTGHPLLRREIAQLYARTGADQIIVTNSGEEPIYIAMRALLQAGDHVIVVWPGYQSHTEIARSMGAEITLLPVRPMSGAGGALRWMIDLDELRLALRPNTRLIVSNFPHNPTGAQPTRAEFDVIAQLAASRDAYWLSDEVYRFLEYAPADRLPAAADVYERAISIGAMSKSFALAGLRIGWAASRDASFMSRLQQYKDFTTICNSAPSEILALMALRARAAVLARTLDIVRRNLALAGPFFEAHAAVFDWTPPSAGSVAFPRLRAGDVEAFADALVTRHNTLILPASVFDYPHPHFRIGLGRNNFPAALERLGRFVTADLR